MHTEPHPPSPPRLPPLTYGPSEVADALGIGEAAFRARRSALEAAGFPRALPALRARWSAEAVAAWIALAGTDDAMGGTGS